MDDPQQTTHTLDAYITAYIALRDKKEAAIKKQKEVIKVYDAALEKIDSYLRGVLQSQNLNSLSCDAGVAFLRDLRSATIADKHLFREYVISNNNFDLVDFHANKDAVEGFFNANNGSLPPGVNYRVFKQLSVNRK